MFNLSNIFKKLKYIKLSIAKLIFKTKDDFKVLTKIAFSKKRNYRKVRAYFLRLINLHFLFPLLIMLFSGILFYIFIPGKTQRIIDSQKNKIQGYWIVLTKTQRSSLDAYINMKLYYKTTLTIDNNFNIQGTGLKFKEISKKNVLNFDRAFWSKSIISGGIIKDSIVLNWSIQDYAKRESLQTLEGSIQPDNKSIIKGIFLNDVGDQYGDFCAMKIELQNFIPDEELIEVMDTNCKKY